MATAIPSIRPSLLVLRHAPHFRPRSNTIEPRHLQRHSLKTTRPRRHPTATNTPARPDLQQRISDRPLPTLAQLSPSRRWIRTLPIFLSIVTASALCIFNYEKANSPIIAATLYALRTNPRVRVELGDEVYFANKWAWIWGSINLVKGNVDVQFAVKGTKGKGMCRYRAKRFGGKAGAFRTQEWSLTLDGDGKVIQLLDEGGDPLRGTGV